MTTAVLEREILQRGHGPVARVDGGLGALRRVRERRRRGSPRSASRTWSPPARNRSANSAPGDAARPRGHSSAPTTTLIPAPMATSCTRTSPVRQPSGDQDVEQHHDEHRERRLPDDEVHRARRVGGEEHHERQHDPEPRVVATDVSITATATPKPTSAPSERLERGRTGAERVRAQHRQRAEHHPERVLDRGGLRHEHRQREPEAGAGRVAEPHRTQVAVGAQDRPARGGARPAPSPCRATASCAAMRRRRRRSAAAASERRRSGKAALKRSTTRAAPSAASCAAVHASSAARVRVARRVERAIIDRCRRTHPRAPARSRRGLGEQRAPSAGTPAVVSAAGERPPPSPARAAGTRRRAAITSATSARSRVMLPGGPVDHPGAVGERGGRRTCARRGRASAAGTSRAAAASRSTVAAAARTRSRWCTGHSRTAATPATATPTTHPSSRAQRSASTPGCHHREHEGEGGGRDARRRSSRRARRENDDGERDHERDDDRRATSCRRRRCRARTSAPPTDRQRPR